ncbi:HNH endonuclease [Arthrobacter sp. TMN-37]
METRKGMSVALHDLTDREAVLRAMEEYDGIGRQAFLAKYGFGQAHKYLLVHKGRYYDSKAIVGVAHRIQTGALLSRSEFSGGVHGAVQRLEALGFDVAHNQPEAGEDQRNAAIELLWNPEEWSWNEIDFQASQDAITERGVALGRWSTGTRKRDIHPGDRVFLFLVGTKNRGLIASGHATSNIFRGPHWDPLRPGGAPYIDVVWDALMDRENILPWNTIVNCVQGFPERFQAGGQKLDVLQSRALETRWQEHCDSTTLSRVETPGSPAIQQSYSYGLAKRRNHQRRFRNLLLANYDPVCHVCGFDQVEILEAAHIVPDSMDGPSTVENGRLLCPNHHRAHDARLFHFKDDRPVWPNRNAEFLAPTRP